MCHILKLLSCLNWCLLGCLLLNQISCVLYCVEWNHWFLWLVGYTLANVGQYVINLLLQGCTTDSCSTCLWESTGPFWQSCNLPSQSSACNDLSCPKYRTLCLSLLNLLRPISPVFLNGSPALQFFSHSPQFSVRHDLAEGAYVPSSQLSMKFLSSSSPSIDPWGR